jgi:Carbohydrate esterase, sialic acid-specific acetylesterase
MMKREMLAVLGAVFLGMLMSCASQPARKTYEPNLRILSPLDYQVFQRGTVAEGKIVLDVAVENADAVEFRLADQPWQAISNSGDGRYRMEATEPAGGWYRVDIRVRQTGRTMDQASVSHVGVGEVFVVGGQSNSTCFGEKRQTTISGLVSNFDGKNWTLADDPLPGVDGKGGSPWPIFGDAMAAKFHVPIGIAPVGAGSTSVRQWLPKGERVQIPASTTRALTQVGDSEWICDGKLFDRMVLRMRQLGINGFRAMLWHQGESDANQSKGRTLPGAKYREYLELIVRSSRTAVGWDVPWFVAQATYHTPTDTGSPDIRAAQKSLWDDGVAMAGPDTDTLTGDNRQNHGKGVHMSDKGLHAHAELWVEKVEEFVERETASQ